jgi:hypothetical protein
MKDSSIFRRKEPNLTALEKHQTQDNDIVQALPHETSEPLSLRPADVGQEEHSGFYENAEQAQIPLVTLLA